MRRFRVLLILVLTSCGLAAPALLGGCAARTTTCEQLWGLTCEDMGKQYDGMVKQYNETNRLISEDAKREGCEVLVKQVALDVALRRSLGETQSAVLQQARAPGTSVIPMPSWMADAKFDIDSRIIADVYAMPQPLNADPVEKYSEGREHLCEIGDPGYAPDAAMETRARGAGLLKPPNGNGQ